MINHSTNLPNTLQRCPQGNTRTEDALRRIRRRRQVLTFVTTSFIWASALIPPTLD
jgi:hypothetical protein